MAVSSAQAQRAGGASTDKGLARNALGLIPSVAVGVSSATPVVGVALVLGLMVTDLGVQVPAIVLLGFLPILLIAGAYRQLNAADPDCGTTFSWATRAFGPSAGWFGGFLIVSSLAVIVTNYAQLLGTYGFVLVGWDTAAGSVAAVTAAGVAWFSLITFIAYRGIDVAKRVQLPLLAGGLLVLLAFAVIALVKGVTGDSAGGVTPALSWFDPTQLSAGALAAGFAAAALLYWGWEATVMVNEETEDRTRTPGRAAMLSTVVLLGIYVVSAVGVLAFAGPERIAEAPEDILGLLGTEVLGSTFDVLLIAAVLTGAIAGGIFLPIGGARTLLSMADRGALPRALGEVHPKYRTPAKATLAFSAIGLVYFVGMTIISDTVLVDSLTALGLIVAAYYALTGLACVAYFRTRLSRSPRELVTLGLAPLAGAAALIFVLIKSAIDLADPAASAGGTEWFGLGAPLVIALAIGLLGLIGTLAARVACPAFFARPAETAPDEDAAAAEPARFHKAPAEEAESKERNRFAQPVS